MKLNEFITELQQLVENRPELGELPVVYARDDEGNGFQLIQAWGPSAGNFDGEYRGDFIPETCLHEWDMSSDDINAVCIN